MNFKWPQTENNFCNPWYVMLKRIIFYPIVMLGGAVFILGVIGSYGIYEAKEIMREYIEWR